MIKWSNGSAQDYARSWYANPSPPAQLAWPGGLRRPADAGPHRWRRPAETPQYGGCPNHRPRLPHHLGLPRRHAGYDPGCLLRRRRLWSPRRQSRGETPTELARQCDVIPSVFQPPGPSLL